jgi:hypothetical protein
MSYFSGITGGGGAYVKFGVYAAPPVLEAPIGTPHFTQNLELSASWLPQFVQNAMILPLSSLCYEIRRQMFISSQPTLHC